MLYLGIILTIIGFVIFQWVANAVSKPFYDRPLIFNKPIPVLIIDLLWIGLLASGLYCLWQVSYKIDLFLFGSYAILWIVDYFLRTYKNKAKKFFQIYKKLKIYHPQIKEEDILFDTARIYFQNHYNDVEEINSILTVIFKKDNKVKDVKDLLRSVFIFENPNNDFGASFNFAKYMKESKKKEAAIEWAYRKVFGDQNKVSERPVLSEDTIRRMKTTGLNPEEMSNEQLAAIEGMENAEKSFWVCKILSYCSIIFGLSSITSLFTVNIISFILLGSISLLLMFIGYKIQTRISSKKFYEASILKWSQEQQKNTESLS